jgi:3-phosphoshikimate 1-carboxyvinyltransferase
MEDFAFAPLPQPFTATITPPGSKSLTNRALVLAALADGTSRVENVLAADDTAVMLDGLRALGFRFDMDGSTATVHGQGGKVPASRAGIACGNSGTTIRFLTALCALGRGEYRLDGDARMRRRPVGPLVDLLTPLGARVEYSGGKGYPPISIHASGLSGGSVTFASDQSSQFLSALLMAAPLAAGPVEITLAGPPTSRPYITMSIELMRRFGVAVDSSDESILRTTPAPYRPADYTVEPDASAASYFLAAAAISPGSSVTIPGLGAGSLQGDIHFADVLLRMGANVVIGPDAVTVTGAGLNGIDIDMTDMPDAAMTLSVVALFATGPTTIRGLHTLPLKESDRLSALETELAKLGARVETTADAISISPPDQPGGARIETYSDHRMAMSFAVAATRITGVVIRDPACVSKTYPGFWQDLELLRRR